MMASGEGSANLLSISVVSIPHAMSQKVSRDQLLLNATAVICGYRHTAAKKSAFM